MDQSQRPGRQRQKLSLALAATLSLAAPAPLAAQTAAPPPGVAAFELLTRSPAEAEPGLRVKLVGRGGAWTAHYSTADGDEIARFEPGGPGGLLALPLPADAPIRLSATAVDGIYDLEAPTLALRVSGLPGRVNQAALKALSPGDHEALCPAPCGPSQAPQRIVIQVLPTPSFEARLQAAIRRDPQ